MKRGFKSWAEKKAEEYRILLGKKYYHSLFANELADHLGLKIITPQHIPNLSKKDSSILLNHDHNSWSAITIKNYLGEYIIISNPSHSKKRQESDLMHEMAHIICEHTMEKIKIRTDFPFPLRDYNTEQEEEAKWFGGCLQVPRRALVQMIYKGLDINELSDHFSASIDMINYRLRMTGVEKQINWQKT
ncbi:MAG: ImmA/IrrE family metallo-endopeptidase [bacterium]|nr:ImmA/IrrE family metallo-endopeptidase [bacterium]